MLVWHLIITFPQLTYMHDLHAYAYFLDYYSRLFCLCGYFIRFENDCLNHAILQLFAIYLKRTW